MKINVLIVGFCMATSLGCWRQCACDKAKQDAHSFWRLEAEKTFSKITVQKTDEARMQLLNFVRGLIQMDRTGNPELKDDQGYTLLGMGVLNDNLEVVEKLLSLDVFADVNATNNYGQTPLMIAVNNGYEKMTKLLLSNGACLDAQSSEGFTALMYAVANKDRNLVKTLVVAGANRAIKNERHKCDAYSLAVKSGVAENIEIIKKGE